MSKQTVLITGGAGFIGSALALRLLSFGYEITILDSLSEQVHGPKPLQDDRMIELQNRTRFLVGSISDAEDVRRALEGVDFVVHLAAETGTGQSMYEIHRYVQTNVEGTALLLDILANERHAVQRLVVASSRSIYGEGRYADAHGAVFYPGPRDTARLNRGEFEIVGPAGEPLKAISTDEGSRLHPSSVYGVTKHSQEQLVLTVCPTIGIAPVALRFQNVYGPGQSLSNPYTGILSIFSSLIREGRTVNVFEDGLETRDFVYIDDVVRATHASLLGGADGRAVNVGSGIPTTVLSVVEELGRAYGLEFDYQVSGNYRIGDIRHNFADIAAASRFLDFQPEWPFSKGIEKFVSWVQSQPVAQSAYDKSLTEMREKRLLQ